MEANGSLFDYNDIVKLIVAMCDADSLIALYQSNKRIGILITNTISYSFSCDELVSRFWNGIFAMRLHSSHSDWYRDPWQRENLAVRTDDVEFFRTNFPEQHRRIILLERAICMGSEKVVKLLQYSDEETALARAIFDEDLEMVNECKHIKIRLGTCRSLKLGLSILNRTKYEDTEVLPIDVLDARRKYRKGFDIIVNNITKYGASISDIKLLVQYHSTGVLKNFPLDIVKEIVDSLDISWGSVLDVTTNLGVMKYAYSMIRCDAFVQSVKLWVDALTSYNISVLDWLITIDDGPDTIAILSKLLTNNTVAPIHLMLKYMKLPSVIEPDNELSIFYSLDESSTESVTIIYPDEVSTDSGTEAGEDVSSPLNELPSPDITITYRSSSSESSTNDEIVYERASIDSVEETDNLRTGICDYVMSKICERYCESLVEYFINYFHSHNLLTWEWITHTIRMSIPVCNVVRRLHIKYGGDVSVWE